MRGPLGLLILAVSLCACKAGVQSHGPQDMQTAFNLFDWMKNVNNVGGGNPGTGQSSQGGLVTLCPPNVVFVLDGSDSVSAKGFEQAKTALIREITTVTKTFANTDVAVILFSDVTEEIPIQKRTTAQLEDMIRQVQNLVQPRRKTSLPAAFRRARQILLNYSVSESRSFNGNRGGNIIVLLSDGTSDNTRAILQESKLAKDRGILVISMSLEDAFLTLLKEISHFVQEYRTAIDWKSMVACPDKILEPVPKNTECRDFIMVVDSSDSVLRHKETVRQYLAYTALRYRLVSNAIGVNVYGTNSQVQAADTRIRLEENKHDLVDKIRLNLMFPTTGGTGTDSAVTQSVGMINDDLRNKSSALLLVIDGPALNPEATRAAIQMSRDSGYPVIIIRVGKELTDQQLDFISGGDRLDVFSVDTFTQLFGVDFDKRACGSRGPCNTLTCPATHVFSQNQCACVCPNTCSGGRTHDSNCQCVCPNQCDANHRQGNNCECYCPAVCPAGTTQLQQNCTCTPCPYTCANAQFQDNWCSCQCNNVCPATYVRAPNCECLCPNGQTPDSNGVCVRVGDFCNQTVCNSPTVPVVGSDGSCRCDCPPNSCPYNAVPTATCGCRCRESQFNYNPNTGLCESGCRNTCPQGQAPDSQDNCNCVCSNVCSLGQFADIRQNCNCACMNVCPAGQIGDTNNTCNCVCNNRCQNGQRASVSSGCQCAVCSNTCPAGQEPNPTNRCVCQCSSNICPPSITRQNPNTCECQCLNPNLAYNCSIGVCLPICTRACPLNSVRNADCTCTCLQGFRLNQATQTCDNICLQTCPWNAIQNPDCSCTCLNGLTFNTATRTCDQICRLQPQDCQNLQVLNTTTCTCVCAQVCPANAWRDGFCSCVCSDTNQRYNSVTNQCDPICTQTCPSNAYRNPDCSCTCLNGWNFNAATRTCAPICQLQPQNCPSPQYVNTTSCTCGCSLVCPANARRDGVCNCICSDTNYRYNSVTNQCDIICVQTCPWNANRNSDCSCTCVNGLTFNTVTRTCDPICQLQPQNCQFPQYLNTTSCTCGCSLVCPANARRDGVCNCVCSDTNYRYNRVTNQCDIICAQTCPWNANRNPDCSCTCVNGLTFNTATRTCDPICQLQPQNCPLPQYLNTTSCTCGCSLVCPANARREGVCNCVCSDTNYRYNSVTNQCDIICVQTCPWNANRNSDCSCTCVNGLTFNTATRTCDPICQLQSQNCPSPQYVNTTSCTCGCSLVCPANARRDGVCNCVCSDTNYRYNSVTNQCDIICVQTCPWNANRNSDCSCTCVNGLTFNTATRTCDPICQLQSQNCPSPQYVNTTSCTCGCSLVCPANARRDGVCNCVCSDTNYRYNSVTNQCDIICIQTCPWNANRNSDCSCTCVNGLTFNTATRTCDPICQLQSQNCPPPQYVNTTSCTCGCSLVCPTNARRDGVCNCVCLDTNYSYNRVTNQCENVCVQTCPWNANRNPDCTCTCLNGFTFNTATRTCEPICQLQSQNCPFPQYVNTTSCTCGCSLVCPANARRDGVCNCICPDTNYRYNSVTNQCDNVCTQTCPLNANRNPDCTCTCLNGLIFNTATRTCDTVCTQTCPWNAIRNSDCSCTCLNGLTFNAATRTCYQPCQLQPQNCVFPDVLNTTTCTCVRSFVCPLKPSDCPFPQQVSIEQCMCACSLSCPTTARRTGICDCECLLPGQRYNSRTNLCEPWSCTQQCPSNAVINSDCSCTCPQGSTFDSTTRTCVVTPLLEICPQSEFACENNQIAYRDCNRHCFCACSAGFAGPRCEIRLEAELCNDCFYDNGHYHAGVKGYCDLYVFCIPVGAIINGTRPQSFTPYIMSCAPGTYYVSRADGWRGCDYLSNGRCTQDKCETLPANAQYTDASGCQSYWQCNSDRKLSARSCCPAGQRFNPTSSSCVIDASCPATCGAARSSCYNTTKTNISAIAENCPFGVNPTNPNEWFYKSQPGEKLYCHANEIMDLNRCICVKSTDNKPIVCQPVINMNFEQSSMSGEDSVPRVAVANGQAANFSGSDDITIKYFAGSGFWTEHFQINLRLYLPKPVVGSQRVAVATNADCNFQESVSITMDDRNFYFKVFPMNSNQSAEIVIPYSGLASQDGWYTLTLRYKKVQGLFEFSGQVGTRTIIYTGAVPLTDYIDMRTCALHIGYGYRYASLVGYVDDFQVWTCDPAKR